MKLASVGASIRFLIVLSLAAVGMLPAAWAGPYLVNSIEWSSASSQTECGGQVVSLLSKLQKQKLLTVHPRDNHYGVTRDSTVHVACIFVGQSEQRRNQWIFYISIASTNSKESEHLLERLRSQLKGSTPID